ncbi:MAG TPA: ABC transporter permease [Ktedonobacteraceae bacterium]|jgi:peptide/nickel transport system permease protein|nr:ABC transporter permease [Ktedonobacteraceae bacterium]
MDISEQLNTTPSAEEDVDSFLELTPTLVQKRRSQGRIIFDRFIRNKAAIVGACFLIFLFLFCFLGPIVTGHNDPNAAHVTSAADTLAGPSLKYPFGTDDVGRDEFARAMVGGQTSLLVGLFSMLMAIILGVGIGAFAGFYGGLVDNLLMRFTDVILAVPLYLLLFVLSASFTDGSPRSVVILIAILSWTYAARLVRGEFLALKEREYVAAARTIGAKDLRLMFRHMLPNAAGPIIVNATLLVSSNIILESVLSYFGFGIKPPVASWGSMLSDGQGLADVSPMLAYIPALLIILTVMSLNLVGDGLRDALDPYMTER